MAITRICSTSIESPGMFEQDNVFLLLLLPQRQGNHLKQESSSKDVLPQMQVRGKKVQVFLNTVEEGTYTQGNSCIGCKPH